MVSGVTPRCGLSLEKKAALGTGSSLCRLMDPAGRHVGHDGGRKKYTTIGFDAVPLLLEPPVSPSGDISMSNI